MKDDITKALEGNFYREDLGEEEGNLPLMVIEDPIERKKTVEKIDTTQDVKDDYTYARDVLLATIKRQEEIIKSMIAFVNASPSPRAYEVLNQMQGTALQTTQDLLSLQEKLKKIQQEDLPAGTGDGDTYYVIGGPVDIVDRMKKEPIDVTPVKLNEN